MADHGCLAEMLLKIVYNWWGIPTGRNSARFYVDFILEISYKRRCANKPVFYPQSIGLKLRKIVPLNVTHEPLKRFCNWAFHFGEKTAFTIAFYMGFWAAWQIIQCLTLLHIYPNYQTCSKTVYMYSVQNISKPSFLAFVHALEFSNVFHHITIIKKYVNLNAYFWCFLCWNVQELVIRLYFKFKRRKIIRKNELFTDTYVTLFMNK